ncbi:MAG: caspase family protein [Sphaerochaetaceae bacterium]|jgi:hypothetical protein|nr:caspase family protein [Sphaerochaetaceae bacterium]MDY0371482.1 caspase family protein [Sphaerochaetaceae bacterium]
MRKKFIISSIILITIITLSGCELLLEKPEKPTIYALLVGIDYKNTIEPLRPNPQENHLEGTIADAEELAAALYHRGAEMGNSVEITLMLQENVPSSQEISSPLYPTESNILNQIERVAGLVSENDTFIFYYAGHGEGPNSNLGYLVPAASENSKSIFNISPMKNVTLRNKLLAIKGTKILILDSCYSGAHEVDYPRSFDARDADSDDFINDYDSSQFYLLASSAQEKSYETFHEDHHGYLTLMLLASLGWQHSRTSTTPIYDPASPSGTKDETIKGYIPEGSKARVERNGAIMMGDIFSFISSDKKNANQTPQTGSGPLDVVLFSRHW